MDGDRLFVTAITLVAVVGTAVILVVGILSMSTLPNKDSVVDREHKTLATQIYELRADVHMLQTQVAGKQ